MSEEIQLRLVEDTDLEVFFQHENDPEAVRRSKFPPREHDAFMAHWAGRILGDPTVLVRTVTVGGETAGNIVAWWQEDRRFIGYVLGQPYWGRGVGTAALGLFLREETVRPLYADPYGGNTGSVRLLERHGFGQEGTVRHGEDEHLLLVLRDGEAAAG